MKTTRELERRIRQGGPDALLDRDFTPPSAADYLQSLLLDRGLRPMDVIRRCNLDRSYGYQLLNGTRIPSRDLILAMALELRFTEAETQRLLKLSGRPVLYARCRRDAAVLYSLCRGLGPEEAERLLRDLSEAPLHLDGSPKSVLASTP